VVKNTSPLNPLSSLFHLQNQYISGWRGESKREVALPLSNSLPPLKRREIQMQDINLLERGIKGEIVEDK
jgi:hypothetical protein